MDPDPDPAGKFGSAMEENISSGQAPNIMITTSGFNLGVRKHSSPPQGGIKYAQHHWFDERNITEELSHSCRYARVLEPHMYDWKCEEVLAVGMESHSHLMRGLPVVTEIWCF